MTNETSRLGPRLRLVDTNFHSHPDGVPEEQLAQPKLPERAEPTVDHPKLLIGSAADHTSISEHAVWIDATLELDAIQEAIREMLKTSPALQAAGKADGTGAWIIHDYLGFGIYEMYEDDQLEVAHELALGIQQYGEAFSGWAEIHHADRSRWADFPAAYLGSYDRLAEYGDQVVAEAGWRDKIAAVVPEALQQHVRIDGAGLAEDLRLRREIQICAKPAGGFWVFRGGM